MIKVWIGNESFERISDGSVSSDEDAAIDYVKQMMSVHSKPCKGSLKTVKKLKNTSKQYSSKPSVFNSKIFTEFDIHHLRKYEFSPEKLQVMLDEKLHEIQYKYEEQICQQ